MIPEEEIIKLKSDIELYRDSAKAAWGVAERLSKELLQVERAYLPQFIFPQGQPNDQEIVKLFQLFLSFIKQNIEIKHKEHST